MRLRENCEPLSKNKNDRNEVKNNAKSIGRREYIQIMQIIIQSIIYLSR